MQTQTANLKLLHLLLTGHQARRESYRQRRSAAKAHLHSRILSPNILHCACIHPSYDRACCQRVDCHQLQQPSAVDGRENQRNMGQSEIAARICVRRGAWPSTYSTLRLRRHYQLDATCVPERLFPVFDESGKADLMLWQSPPLRHGAKAPCHSPPISLRERKNTQTPTPPSALSAPPPPVRRCAPPVRPCGHG